MWKLFSGSEPWFRPKTLGYGSGLPIAWQGWVVLLSYMVAMIVLSLLLALGTVLAVVATVTGWTVLTALFLVVAKAHTEGGWRWCDGGEE